MAQEWIKQKDGTFKRNKKYKNGYQKQKDGKFKLAPIKEDKKETTKNTETVSQHKTKEAEEKERQKALFDYQFSKKDESGNVLGGLSWEEVQEEKKKYGIDSAEYQYLSNYTNYTNMLDFDKALQYEKKEYEYNGQRLSKAEVINNGYTIPYINNEHIIPFTLESETGKNVVAQNILSASNQFSVPAQTKTPTIDYSAILGQTPSNQKVVSNAKVNQEYIDALEKAKNTHALDNQFDYYKHYMDEKDFAKKSKYNKENIEKNWLGVMKDFDELYYYLNLDEKEQNIYIEKTYGMDASMNMPQELNYINYISDSEKGVFNYLFNTDKKKAKEYFDDIKTNLSRRNAKRVVEQTEAFADEHPVTASTLSVPMNVVGGMSGGIDTIISKAKGEEIDYYSSAWAGNLMATTIRNKVGEKIADSTKEVEILGTNVPSFLYQSGMSVSDTLLGSAIFGKGYSVIAGSAAYQSKARELYEAGEDRDTIEKVAIASGTAEVLFEYISLDKLLNESTVIGVKQIIKNALKQAGVEASEEFCTEIANIYIDEFGRGGNSDLNQMRKELKAQGYSDKEIEKKINQQVNKQIGEALVGGALSGGFMGGGMSAINNSKYTNTEKQFISDTVQERVDAKEKESGKKLTTHEKLKIQDDVVNELHNGDFSREELEQRFGGESYKEYQQLLKDRDEFVSLRNMRNGDRTGVQDERLYDLRKMNNEKSFEDRLAESRSKLADTVKGATGKSSMLDLMYGERGRRTEQFTVSEEQMNKYSEKEREIIQKALDYGEMNNTRKAHEFVDLVAKLSADKGVSFDFTNNEKLKNSGFAIEGKTINGFKQGNNVTVNLQSTKALNTVVGHEITHVLEGTQLYQELQNTVIEYAKQKGVYDSMYKDIVHLYRNQFQDSDLETRKALYDSEITADLVGEYIFSDIDFVRNLSTKNPNAFQKVFNEIKYMLKSAKAGSDSERQLLKAKKIFEDVYRDTKKNTSEDVRYSTSEVVELSKDSELAKQVKNLYGAEKYKKIQEYILDALSEQPIKLSDGKNAIVDRRDALHMANKSASRKTAEISKIKEIVEKAKLYAEDKNVEHNKFDYFCYYQTGVKLGEDTYPIYLNVGRAKNDGAYHIYDITQTIRDTADRINGLERPKPNEGYALQNGISNNIISERQQNTTENQKHSLSDNAIAPEPARQTKGIQYSLADIEGMTEKSYNHHGWAKVNDVLSDRELADFQSKVGDKARIGESWYMNLGDGRHMFAVGVDGVNSTLIISDGNFQRPSIDKVYHIDLNNETDIEIVRDVIYDKEKNGEWTQSSDDVESVFGDGVVGTYTTSDFFDFQTMWEEYRSTGGKGQGNTRSPQNMQNRTGSNSKTRIEFSISEDSKMSSGDGIFFDEKNIAKNGKHSTHPVQEKPIAPIKNGIYAEDVVLEKPIAPIAEKFAPAKEDIFSLLKKYSADEENNILKGRNRTVLKTREEIRKFVEDAIQKTEQNAFGYLGIVTPDTIDRIKTQLTDISDANKQALLKRDSYSLRIGQSEIRHLQKSGMSIHEVKDYVEKIPQIVTEFDSARYTIENHDGQVIQGIRFEKTFADGRMYSYIMVSNKKGTLTMKTTFMDKNDYKKKKHSLLPDTQSATDYTSKTKSSSASTNSIPQSTENTTKFSDNFAPIAKNAQRKQRSYVETATESDVVNRQILPEDLDQEAITYVPISNQKTLNTANADLDRMGYDKALQVFNAKMESRTLSLSDIALGERLIQESLKRGDRKTTSELIQDISILGTELGQKVQALSIIQRMTPEGQLKLLQKIVNRGKAKGDKVFEHVEITDKMVDDILGAYNEDGTYDQDKLNGAVESAKQQIADQMEVTNMDKVNAWRMLSMLGNPKTHIRNIVSNVTMQVTSEMKNALARTIETIAPIKNRTKTWKSASEDVKKFAEQSTKEAESILMGEHSYSEVADIKAKRDVFKNKILQKVYDFNSDMLTKEDAFFKRPVYRKSLQEFLTANGIKTQEDIQNNKELVEKGKRYALEQSQIATFQQYSWLANKINEIERKNVATQIGVGAVLPFKKTPINIAKTGLAYSPLGFAKSLSYDLVQMKKGNMEASQVIDNLSKGVTGFALTYIGYMLAMSGLLNGGGEEDKEGKYDYQLGEQTYSLNFGGNTYSLSWLTPVAMPLFVGANFYEAFKEGKEFTFDATADALAQTLDPMSEMSFLSSLDSVLTSYESGVGKFMGIIETAGQNYITQFAPTLMSQFAQITDDKKRSTQVAADSGARPIEQTINKLMYKIPGLRQTLEPTIDIWGNEVKQSENVVERAVETFIAPYSRKESIATEIDEEIKALYSQTGDGGIIPNVPTNKIKYGGDTYRMSAKEFTDYKKTYGRVANEMLEDLFRTTTYQNADSTTKAELVNKVYDYARDVSKKDYLEKEGVEYTNTTENGLPVYKENKIKGAIDNDMLLEEFDLYTKSKGKYHISQLVGGYDNYKEYTSALEKLEADKNAQGKSIPNSLKNKKFAYINNLNVDYCTKMLLWKQQYPSDDRYNMEIIEYLNNRQDISYQDMVDILTELDFKVSADGRTVY